MPPVHSLGDTHPHTRSIEGTHESSPGQYEYLENVIIRYSKRQRKDGKVGSIWLKRDGREGDVSLSITTTITIIVRERERERERELFTSQNPYAFALTSISVPNSIWIVDQTPFGFAFGCS